MGRATPRILHGHAFLLATAVALLQEPQTPNATGLYTLYGSSVGLGTLPDGPSTKNKDVIWVSYVGTSWTVRTLGPEPRTLELHTLKPQSLPRPSNVVPLW